MYESFFGLSEPPFALTPDPRFLWPSETHEEGLATLVYGIRRRKGLVLLTGEVGTGKTTLVRAALQQTPAATARALVLHTAGLRPLDLLKLIASDFGLDRSDSKADLITALRHFLVERHRAGLDSVLVVDEAQGLARQALEELRLLSNLETDSEKLLQVVLIGQPELRCTLARPELRSLRQRIALEYHVQPLAPDEVPRYLAHRLEVAGGCFEDVFLRGVEPIFVAASGGCPRILSLLADRALLAAYARELRPVPPQLVEKKAKELESASLKPPGSSSPADRSVG